MTVTEVIGDLDWLFRDTRVSKQQTLSNLEHVEDHIRTLKDALRQDMRREAEVGEGQ